MKALSIRLENSLSRQFDEACRQSGIKKNTLVTRLIVSFVNYQKEKGKLKNHKSHDPFLEVVGFMNIPSMLVEEGDIDHVVYDAL